MHLFYQCIYLSIALCRTARGDNQGSALSFVSVKDMDLLVEVEKTLSESGSEYTHHNEHRVKHCLHSSQLTQNQAVSTIITQKQVVSTLITINTESGSEYTHQ